MIRDGHAEPLEPQKRCSSGKPLKKVRQVYKVVHKHTVTTYSQQKRKEIVDALTPVDLDKVLGKYIKEENVTLEDQPLYKDVKTESIRCRWCSLFKGSTEARVINQHMKTSKSFLKHRSGPCAEETQGVDIRPYF